MIIEGSKDAAKFPIADEGHNRLGAMLLMKFQSTVEMASKLSYWFRIRV